MVRRLKNVKLRLRSVQVLIIFLLKMCIFFGQETAPIKRIVIDPGHGGKDSGAIGINGIQEKDVVLNIAKEIVRLNRELFKKEFEIYLTRYRDTLISLSDRTKLAKSLKADLFISLHCNHSENQEVRGVEVYVAKTETAHLKKSIYLSFLLQKGFRDKLGFESRGVKFRDFKVLREGAQYYPALLLELGFLSNRDESFYHIFPESADTIALVIIRSLINIISCCW